LIEVLRTITPRLHEPLWTNVLGDQADAILAVVPALSRAVAPETEWEYRIVIGDRIRYTEARSEAVRARLRHGDAADVRRRRPKVERPAGPWEEMPDAE
ncbi:hypothetical protein JD276_15640, partial [Leucobacter sp. CSA1]